MTKFEPFPKIKRLFRDIVVTEKLDGTNASISIHQAGYDEYSPDRVDTDRLLDLDGFIIYAGSRSKWIYPGKNDNYGFAGWVKDNAKELLKLGPGHHFGEWWGKGIQRGYSLTEKRFSLFNTSKWLDDSVRPKCCSVVPVLYEGKFHTEKIKAVLRDLVKNGSAASPGFMDPEGICVFHSASNLILKFTTDDNHKGVDSVSERSETIARTERVHG